MPALFSTGVVELAGGCVAGGGAAIRPSRSAGFKDMSLAIRSGSPTVGIGVAPTLIVVFPGRPVVSSGATASAGTTPKRAKAADPVTPRASGSRTRSSGFPDE